MVQSPKPSLEFHHSDSLLATHNVHAQNVVDYVYISESTVCMESLYLHLGIGPARDLYNHVEDSFLSISVKRNVVEWGHNTIATLCLVCARKRL